MYGLAAAAVFAFALGVLVRDVAQDYAQPDQVCQRAKEDAEHYATLIAKLLNEGGTLTAPGTTVSCRPPKHSEEKA